MVSLTDRAIVAILYEVEAIDAEVSVVLQSELVANEPTPEQSRDPRTAAALESPLVSEMVAHGETSATLVHRTRRSGQRLAAAMDHVVEGRECRTTTTSSPDLARTTVTTRLRRGERIRLTKFVAYGWSSRRTEPALRAQVEGALASAAYRGWDGLAEDQHAYLDDFWKKSDVELEGDPELQQAIRFGMFHVLQAGARAQGRAIPAKGLTGPGYDGHTFWDTEIFALQALTYIKPEAARDALIWRHSTLDLAKERARVLGFKGAAFPWRTIRGQECSGYWPASTAALHINADIAHAVTRYSIAANDPEFDRGVGVELLVETARLWESIGTYDLEGWFRIDGVTGPDEYTAIADNNLFTNLLAQGNLRSAVDAVKRYPDVAQRLGVTDEEVAAWRKAAECVVIPYDDELKVHQQSHGFTRHAHWDFENTRQDQYPLLLHFPYFNLYRSQVLKQADLVLAIHLRGDAFTPEEKLRDFDYYEQITVRDSSLSACSQAVVAAEVGHLDLAYAYLGETAFMDLANIERNVRDGLHLAALSGGWIAVVAGFAGFRDHAEAPRFNPRLPPPLSRIRFGMAFRGSQIRVDIEPEHTTYSVEGQARELWHANERFTVKPGESVKLANEKVPERPSPRQPKGREPFHRGESPHVWDELRRPSGRMWDSV